MANFNTLSEAQIKNELGAYGYTWIATTNPSSPLQMYFKDSFNFILSLSVDTTSYATTYLANEDFYYIEQNVIILPTIVTDLVSYDTLLKAVYDTEVDPLILRTERIISIDGLTVLTPTGGSYYDATVMQDSLLNSYNISIVPAPYRYREVYWIPITFVDPNWVLTDNNSVIVNTADKVTNAYGDFIVIKI